MLFLIKSFASVLHYNVSLG